MRSVCIVIEYLLDSTAAVEVWTEYCSLALASVSEPDGQENCRAMFERALSNGGLHVVDGSLLWDSYRDLEEALGDTKKYLSVCRRQLSIPLFGMEHAYEQIKEKIEIDENMEQSYRKALEKLKVLKQWEEKLLSAPESEKASIYKEYIAYEMKEKQPPRVLCLYER